MSAPPPTIRLARVDDLPHLERVRAAAFGPVFESFRTILGDDVYDAAQAHEDAEQPRVLASLFEEGSPWEVHVARADDSIVGFVSIRLDRDRRIGEIGLNAVHPDHAGRGIGTVLYEMAVERMREAGMKVATVATGGDPSHAPARRAYRKAGFDVEIPSVWMCRML